MTTQFTGPVTPDRGFGARHQSDLPIFPAFDNEHPPDSKLVDDCVHCGFCLPSCPTYVLWGEEMDSPRGRIYLMKQGLNGSPMDSAMVSHIDKCLGCVSCVTACPSGVQYGKLLEATRAQIQRRYRRPAMDRLLRFGIFALFPYPKRLALLRAPLRKYQMSNLSQRIRQSSLINKLAPGVVAMEALLPPLQARQRRLRRRIPADGTHRRTVGMLTGCVQSIFFPLVNAATTRVLAAEGCDVVVPRGQTCCGALSLHMGREAEAREFAQKMIDTFNLAGVENVVVNAAGCGSAMKDYGHLLRDDPNYAEAAAMFSASVKDVTELIDELGPVAPRHDLAVRAAYHDACHLAHGQQIRRQPRDLLRSIPGLELIEIPESDICCGSAGVYNILEPKPAAELGQRKANNVVSTGADVLITANPGCLLQIAAALPSSSQDLQLFHTVEVLDASIRGVPLSRGRNVEHDIQPQG